MRLGPCAKARIPSGKSYESDCGNHGIDPEAAEVVEAYMEGPTRKPVEVGVVVSADARVFEYAYSEDKEQWTKWLDRTHNWRDAKCADAVEDALKRLSGLS